MITLLRVARLLRQDSLDATALALGTVKGHLSELERFSGRHASKSLQTKIAARFGAPWNVLIQSVDGRKLAASVLASAKAASKNAK